jgi:hypothetical protein
VKRRRVVSAVVVAVIAVAALVILAVYGFFNRLVGGGVAHPPCEQLPRRSQVAQAIDQHAGLVERLTAAGDGVEVIFGTPCSDPDRAVVAVRVTTSKEEASVREILGHSDGFGVPAIVEKH